MRQVIYDPINSSKMYLERTIGIPTIRNSAGGVSDLDLLALDR
jgi:hypothetical protein